MYKSVNLKTNKLIGTYNSLQQCAKHIKRIDENMIKENKSLLDIFITLDDLEISEYEYKQYKIFYELK